MRAGLLALWSCVWHIASTQQMLFPSPFSTILPPLHALSRNSIICLCEIPVILECLREGEWWEARKGVCWALDMVFFYPSTEEALMKSLVLRTGERLAILITPRNWPWFDILGICLASSCKYPTCSPFFLSSFTYDLLLQSFSSIVIFS